MNKDELESNCYALLEQAIHAYRKFAQREFGKRNFDVSVEQWSVLKGSRDHPGLTQNELAKAIRKDPASVTRMIDILEKKGLLKRKPVKNDRRSHSIHLTETGATLVEEIGELNNEIGRYALRTLSKSEMENFAHSIGSIRENLEPG